MIILYKVFFVVVVELAISYWFAQTDEVFVKNAMR